MFSCRGDVSSSGRTNSRSWQERWIEKSSASCKQILGQAGEARKELVTDNSEKTELRKYSLKGTIASFKLPGAAPSGASAIARRGEEPEIQRRSQEAPLIAMKGLAVHELTFMHGFKHCLYEPLAK